MRTRRSRSRSALPPSPIYALRWDAAHLPARAARRRDLAHVPANAWLYVVLSRGAPPSAPDRRARPMRPAAIAALLTDDACALLLSPADRRAGLASLALLLDELSAAPSCFITLVARRAAPAHDFRFDGEVTSFACSARVLRGHAAALDRPETLCFAALRGVMAGRPSVARLIVRQLPLHAPHTPSPTPTVAVLLPHRGPATLLTSALRALAHAAGTARVLVGLDSRGVAAYRRLAARYPAVELHHSTPAPVGPYAVRHALARRTRATHLLFHDSDDVSCADRIPRLHHTMQRTGTALVGSHELRVDELRGRVTATRFPLDVDAALRVHPHHPMLFPSTMIRRDAYFAVGGLSTDRAFAYDTQFVFRASLGLRLANVDDFLYIRRRRAGSLTTTPATALGTPIRVALLASWVRDLHAIRANRLTLGRSSLRVMARRAPFTLEALAPPRRAPASRAARSRRSR